MDAAILGTMVIQYYCTTYKSQSAFACSKSTIETLKKGVKYA